jgi:hypothetical protein
MTSREQHDADHNSLIDPKPDCEHCRLEVYRRTHHCFGDGASTTPTPVRQEDSQ